MPDFDIDHLKKTWQEHQVAAKYSYRDILPMLNKRSKSYVKTLLLISLAEFILFLSISIFYIFESGESASFMNILSKLGIDPSRKPEQDFEHIYFVLKLVSLAITGYFVVKLYQSYRRISVEANLRKFILQIIGFKRTVNSYIFTNLVLLVIFTAVLTGFTFSLIAAQGVEINQEKLVGFVTGIITTTVFAVLLLWLYYRLVYGILINRLSKIMVQLAEIDAQNS